MMESVDMEVSKTSARKGVRVRVPLPAQAKFAARRSRLGRGCGRGGTGAHKLPQSATTDATTEDPNCNVCIRVSRTSGEAVDQLLAERLQVVRFPARDDDARPLLVDVHLFVHPGAAGVANVRLQARPRRQRAALHHTRLDQGPWAVT